MSLKLLAPLVVLSAAAVVRSRTEVTGGAGAGTYAAPFGCAGLGRVPYKEAALDIRQKHGNGFVVGGGMAVRDDDEDAAEILQPDDNATFEIRPGTRWRATGYAGYHGRWFRARGGLVVGDYYNPREGQAPSWVLPRIALGLGTEQLHLDAGIFDGPALASSADGGQGVLSLRLTAELAPGHEASFALGAAAGDGYASAQYLGDAGNGIRLGAGGFAGQYSKAAFLIAGTTFDD